MSLGLTDEEASTLNTQYYTQYGLALRGLHRHHGVGNTKVFFPTTRILLTLCCVDPIDFDEKCDGSLPLEQMLKPNPLVRRLLQDIDRSKCRVWALTNAYRTVRQWTHRTVASLTGSARQHAERVLQILGLRDQIEGVVFCDYRKEDITCKPEPAFYLQVCSTLPSSHYCAHSNEPDVAGNATGWGDGS